MAKKNTENDSNDVEMPLVQHLKELRDRLMKCLLALFLVFAALFSFNNEIYSFIAQPMINALPEGSKLISIGVFNPMFVALKTTFYVSFLITMPLILFQIWGFIAPALYRKEKRVAIPLFISTVLLFYAGVAFAYYVILPIVFKFMVGMTFDDVEMAPDIKEYLGTVLKMGFAFGLAFEIPVATILLIWAGIVSPDSLAQKRPYVFVGCFIFGMLLTPPDIFSQTLLAIPMWLLFEAGVFFGRWVHNNAEENNEEVKT